jgi:hypothetical protein
MIKSGSCIWFTLIACLTGIIMAKAFPCGAETSVLPFCQGEELIYDVRWEMISAGRARFRVNRISGLNGMKARHFTLELESNHYIDMLYKIRDRVEGFTDTGFTRSVFYRKTQSGKDKKQIEIHFDLKNHTAEYSNFGGKRPAIHIPPDTFDPLSAFYRMRTLEFKTGKTLCFPVTDGKKYFIQKAVIIKKEKIKLSSALIDTYLLELQVNHFSGAFKKSKNPGVKIWVTADKKKIPVKIKIKVFIGSIFLELVSPMPRQYQLSHTCPGLSQYQRDISQASLPSVLHLSLPDHDS